MLLLIFGIVQAGLFYNARNVASSAAQVGLEAVRAENGSVGAGATAATAYLGQIGGVNGLAVTGSRSPTQVSVTVSIDAPVLIDGLPLPRITAAANAPVERFIP